MFCSDVNATAALRMEFAEVGAIWVASKLGGPNINGMAAVAKFPSTVKLLEWVFAGEPTCDRTGKADDAGEETGKCTPHTAATGARASKERLAEITSGRAVPQQGLAATCKDPPTKATTVGGGRVSVCRMRSYERGRRGNAL